MKTDLLRPAFDPRWRDEKYRETYIRGQREGQRERERAALEEFVILLEGNGCRQLTAKRQLVDLYRARRTHDGEKRLTDNQLANWLAGFLKAHDFPTHSDGFTQEELDAEAAKKAARDAPPEPAPEPVPEREIPPRMQGRDHWRDKGLRWTIENVRFLLAQGGHQGQGFFEFPEGE